MLKLAKSNETENKPKNVEKAIEAGWKTAKEMYEACETSRQTWENFLSDVRKATLQKPDSSCKTTFTTEKCITGPHNTKYYHPKVEEAFQLWLKKNAMNAGGQRTEGSKNWYSKQELAIEFGVDPKTIQRIVNEQITLDRPVQTKKGGYNNSEILYNKDVYNMITAELAKHNTNQNTGAIQKQMSTEAKEQGILLNAVANSGDLKAAQALCDLIMEKTQIQAENKRLLEQTKQMEHALNYTAVIGWKKWSDLKKELAQNFEIFQHRISFKTVAAEAGLVKETDYAERIYGEDCFPTTMISESGIDKIYNCYDR